ncbi:MAG: hypothetical protein RJA34_1383 [Pseudomonadota bacterium]|jgi:hypothetical protein
MPHNDDLTNETVQLVREVFAEAKIGQPTPGRDDGSDEVRAARCRVDGLFGKGMLTIAIIPSVFSLSPKLDSWFSFIFLMFGLVFALIGTFYIDRATNEDRKLIAAR